MSMTNNGFRNGHVPTPGERSQVIVFQKTAVFACRQLTVVINAPEKPRWSAGRC